MAQDQSRPLAKRYALALYRLAKAEGIDVTAFADTVTKLRLTIISDNNVWQAMAASPQLSREQKKSILEKMIIAQKITDKKASDLLLGFFGLLSDKGRLATAGMMLEEVITMLLQESGQLVALVTTAQELDSSEKKMLEKELVAVLPKWLAKEVDKDTEKKLDKNLTLRYKTDASLLGGLTVTVESYNIDLSVKSKLARLEQNLS